eukprot:2033859-Rhodomonas_salina.1
MSVVNHCLAPTVEGGVGNEKEETQRDDWDSHPKGNWREASQPEGPADRQPHACADSGGDT